MKRIVFSIALAAALFSCKNETSVTSSTAVDQDGRQASYAFGVMLGQGSQTPTNDTIDYKQMEKGIKDYLDNPKKMDSYSQGLVMGQRIQAAMDNEVLKGGIDKNEVIAGMMDFLNKRELRISTDSVNHYMDNFYQKRAKQMSESNVQKGTEYMAQIKNEPGVQTTPSGLAYKVVQPGSGPTVQIGDMVSVKYTGQTINGKVFDSTDKNNQGEPIQFPVQDQGLITGWIEGLQLMQAGGKYKLYIPSNLGYGDQAAGEIPPGATLIFDIEVLEIGKMPKMDETHPGVNIETRQAQPTQPAQ
ncbi:MAG: FKBP-type peptidyl-prolyl cis-trans isomerase [Weeksellaceae bacterium]|nr:FKBP-type peptidyl-prolyl cis-trans isomerase [Weeksellaceae bacterium]